MHCLSDRLSNDSIPVAVHGAEESLQRSLLFHELLKGELAVVVAVHLTEELRHLLPKVTC